MGLPAASLGCVCRPRADCIPSRRPESSQSRCLPCPRAADVTVPGLEPAQAGLDPSLAQVGRGTLGEVGPQQGVPREHQLEGAREGHAEGRSWRRTQLVPKCRSSPESWEFWCPEPWLQHTSFCCAGRGEHGAAWRSGPLLLSSPSCCGPCHAAAVTRQPRSVWEEGHMASPSCHQGGEAHSGSPWGAVTVPALGEPGSAQDPGPRSPWERPGLPQVHSKAFPGPWPPCPQPQAFGQLCGGSNRSLIQPYFGWGANHMTRCQEARYSLLPMGGPRKSREKGAGAQGPDGTVHPETPGHGEDTLAAGWAHGDIYVPGSLWGPTH